VAPYVSAQRKTGRNSGTVAACFEINQYSPICVQPTSAYSSFSSDSITRGNKKPERAIHLLCLFLQPTRRRTIELLQQQALQAASVKRSKRRTSLTLLPHYQQLLLLLLGLLRWGTLKTRHWKTWDHEKCNGGKSTTGRHGNGLRMDSET